MKMSLEIKIDRLDNAIDVKLVGAVDASAADKLKAEVLPLCEQPEARVILDFSDLSYINSMCMGQLNVFSRRCKEQGGAFAIYEVAPNILEVMKLIHLPELVSVCSSRDEALLKVGA